jgi:hypothetical protein
VKNKNKQTPMSLTDESMIQWQNTIGLKSQLERLQDWANMLEARVAQLDPDYRAYPWGRNFTKEIRND